MEALKAMKHVLQKTYFKNVLKDGFINPFEYPLFLTFQIQRMKIQGMPLNVESILLIQARIAQLVAYQLGTGEVSGSNPGKGENFSMKISN